MKPDRGAPNPDLTDVHPESTDSAEYVPVAAGRSRWVQRVRAFLGLRRLPPIIRYRAVPRASVPTDAEAASVRVAMRYALAVLAFAACALLLFVAYGMIATGPTAINAPGSEALVTEAVRRMRAGDLAGARSLRDQAFAANRHDPLVYFFDGFLLASEQGDKAATVSRLSAWPWRRSAALRNTLTLAGYHLALGDTTASQSALAKAVEIAPTNVGVRAIRANVFLATRNYQAVVAEANELEKLGSTPRLPLIMRGMARLALGQHQAARHDLEAAALVDPGNPRVHLGLAEALMHLGEYERADQEASLALRYDPKSADAYLSKGCIAEKAGAVDRAEAMYRKAIEINPRHGGALNNLAYLLLTRRQRPNEALEFAKRAYQIAPEAPSVADTLGWTYMQLGRVGDALPLLRKAAQATEDAEIHVHYARALLATGDTATARKVLEAAARSPGEERFRKEARDLLQQLGPQ